MKKSLLLIPVFLGIFTPLKAQEDIEKLKAKIAHLESVNQKNLAVLESNQAKKNTSDSILLANIKEEIDKLSKFNNSNNESIQELYSGRVYDATTKYNIIKNNLSESIKAFEYLNTKTNSLKSMMSNNSFDILIKELNNPQSKSLEFTFDEVVIELVKEHIKPKKKSVTTKLFATIESITKSPIINSIPLMSPALSVANSVISTIRGVSIFDDKIDISKIQEFEIAINNYLQYYTALSNANQEFDYSINKQEVELNILQQKIYEQIYYFAKTLDFPVLKKKEQVSTGDYLNQLFTEFNKEYIDQMFSDLESKHKRNYSKILKNQNIKDVNNRLEEFITLVNQFEILYNTYFESLEKYNLNIKNSLEIAKKNKIAKEHIVDKKKVEFDKAKSKSIEHAKISIHLNQLIQSKKKIKYTARII